VNMKRFLAVKIHAWRMFVFLLLLMLGKEYYCSILFDDHRYSLLSDGTRTMEWFQAFCLLIESFPTESSDEKAYHLFQKLFVIFFGLF